MAVVDVEHGPLADLIASVVDRASTSARTLVGIGGPVAVGKSTLAAAVAAAVASAGPSVSVLCADAFLRPNSELASAGLMMKKGFPETFDLVALAAALERLRGGEPAEVPVYSHDTYDRVPGVTAVVEPAAVVVVEGVIALHPAVVDQLDVAVYIDAAEADVIGWFTARFLDLCAEAERGTGTPFYRVFSAMSADERRQTARNTWDGINGVNLAQHIAPSAANAHVVLVKAADHAVVALRRQRQG